MQSRIGATPQQRGLAAEDGSIQCTTRTSSLVNNARMERSILDHVLESRKFAGASDRCSGTDTTTDRSEVVPDFYSTFTPFVASAAGCASAGAPPSEMTRSFSRLNLIRHGSSSLGAGIFSVSPLILCISCVGCADECIFLPPLLRELETLSIAQLSKLMACAQIYPSPRSAAEKGDELRCKSILSIWRGQIASAFFCHNLSLFPKYLLSAIACLSRDMTSTLSFVYDLECVVSNLPKGSKLGWLDEYRLSNDASNVAGALLNEQAWSELIYSAATHLLEVCQVMDSVVSGQRLCLFCGRAYINRRGVCKHYSEENAACCNIQRYVAVAVVLMYWLQTLGVADDVAEVKVG
jgi:hypothetical protein